MPTVAGRFEILDGMRGIAAATVVIYHLPELFFNYKLHSNALAVALFFCLSGFVLCQAYEDRLRCGDLTFVRFLILRFIRLYPLLLLALIIGLIFYVVRPSTTVEPLAAGTTIALSLLVLPTPSTISGIEAPFPLNPPMWSLFYEFLLNAIFAFFILQLTTSRLLIIASVSALFMLTLGLHFAYDFSYWNHLVAGSWECITSFCLGIVAFRVFSRNPPKPIPAICSALILAALLFVPVDGYGFHIYGFFCIFFFPILLIYSTGVPRSALTRNAMKLIGDASYPVYVLHMPIILWLASAFKRISGNDLSAYSPWSGIAFLVCLVALSVTIDRAVDRPIRILLQSRFFKSTRTLVT